MTKLTLQEAEKLLLNIEDDFECENCEEGMKCGECQESIEYCKELIEASAIVAEAKAKEERKEELNNLKATFPIPKWKKFDDYWRGRKLHHNQLPCFKDKIAIEKLKWILLLDIEDIKKIAKEEQRKEDAEILNGAFLERKPDEWNKTWHKTKHIEVAYFNEAVERANGRIKQAQNKILSSNPQQND